MEYLHNISQGNIVFMAANLYKNDVMRLGERPHSLEGKPWDRQTDIGTDIGTDMGTDRLLAGYNSIHNTHYHFTTIRNIKTIIVFQMHPIS